MPLSDIRLKTSIAHPVIEPPLDWAIINLLIWDHITLIWDPNDRNKLEEYATRSPILLDRGLVQLSRPTEADVNNASAVLRKLLEENPDSLPADPKFAEEFDLHPVKVTAKYWDNARRAADGFVSVPKKVGALYVGLLASEMAQREKMHTVAMRNEEALWIGGSNGKPIHKMAPSDCVGRAAFKVLSPELENPFSCDENLIKGVCDDIVALRNLDGWHDWREHLCSYMDALDKVTPDALDIASISERMNASVKKFEAEVKRQKWVTMGKVGVAIVGGVVGFFTGSLPGAIAGAAGNGAAVGIDLYEAREREQAKQANWQHFVIEARKRFD